MINIEVSLIRQLTIYTLTGKTTLHDLLEEVENFYKEEPTENVLWNLLEANLYNLNAKDAEVISSHSARYDNNIKRRKTAIVSNNEHTYLLAEWFKLYGEMDNLPFKVGVFESLSEAKHWLDWA